MKLSDRHYRTGRWTIKFPSHDHNPPKDDGEEWSRLDFLNAVVAYLQRPYRDFPRFWVRLDKGEWQCLDWTNLRISSILSSLGDGYRDFNGILLVVRFDKMFYLFWPAPQEGGWEWFVEVLTEREYKDKFFF